MNIAKKLISLLVVLVACAALTGCNAKNKVVEKQSVVIEKRSQEDKPKADYSGTVSDSDGNAIKDAKLYILRRNNIKAVSGQQGGYEMVWGGPEFPESHEIFIIARHEGNNLASATKVVRDTQIQNITLKPAITATGAVTDPDGKPIENVKVSVGFITKFYITSFSEKDTFGVNSRGIYRVPFIPPNHRYSVSSYAEGYGSERIIVNSDDAVNGVLELNPLILLKANETVSGVVVNSDGKPVPNAKVYRKGDHQPLGSKKTNADGTFIIAVCKGDVLIGSSVKKDGVMLAGNVMVSSGSEDVKIVLEPRP